MRKGKISSGNTLRNIVKHWDRNEASVCFSTSGNTNGIMMAAAKLLSIV